MSTVFDKAKADQKVAIAEQAYHILQYSVNRVQEAANDQLADAIRQHAEYMEMERLNHYKYGLGRRAQREVVTAYQALLTVCQQVKETKKDVYKQVVIARRQAEEYSVPPSNATCIVEHYELTADMWSSLYNV